MRARLAGHAGVLVMAGLLGTLCLGPRAGGQEIVLGGDLSSASAHKQHVEFAGASARVKANAPQWVDLRFAVDPGFHINSHTPHDELLIPTALTITGDGLVKVQGQRYPAGIPLRLQAGSGVTLSTYQGEFQVELQVVAPKGDHPLSGTLRYQACDGRACFPPRTLPVQLMVTGE